MEEAKIKSSVQLPESIIKYYAKYRNENGTYKSYMIKDEKFEIDDRYEIIDMIGSGAYGIVVAGYDKEIDEDENNLIAIKKIEKAFEQRLFTKRTLRELKILRLLKHENIIGLEKILLPKSREEFNDIYVVQELMETDLNQIIKSKQELNDEHCQFILYQILRGMKYVHSANILHRDLKPRNLLINTNCDLKICDFGLARECQKEQEIAAQMTDYIVTRWYRAPELLLSQNQYTKAVDVWSIGCIFAELLRGQALLTGNDSYFHFAIFTKQLAMNQIEKIFEIFGTPCVEDINSIPNLKKKNFIQLLGKKRKGKNLQKIFIKASPEALDLLKKFLAFNPQKRITIEEALEHPYLKDYHQTEDEPIAEPVPSLEFEFEKYNLTIQQLKDLIYEEILIYYYEDFRKEYEEKIKNGQSVMQHVLNNENSQIVNFDIFNCKFKVDDDSDDEIIE